MSNFNLYKTNKNKSNTNIFSYNDKIISTKNNNNLNTLNQNISNLKYKDLLFQYNINYNLLNKNNAKNKYLSFRNKAIIFPNFQQKPKKRISSSLTHKEIFSSKNNKNQKSFSLNNIKSRSSANFYKNNNKINAINKYANKNNTDNNFVN